MWVVLERGVLSYFQTRGDASTGTKRKGMKYLDEARLWVRTLLNFFAVAINTSSLSSFSAVVTSS